MSEFKNKLPEPPRSELAAYSKQVQESQAYQDDIKRYEKELEIYEKDKQREIELTKHASEKESERIEKQNQIYNDRWFAAKMLIIGAIIGGLISTMLNFIFK